MRGLNPRGGLVALSAAMLLASGCSLDPTSVTLPGGADVGDDPYSVKIEFNDVLDLVPQSAVRVDDIAVGRVTDIELKGWTAEVTVLLNGDVELPDNAEATIRQSSLLGEKFVHLAAPEEGSVGALEDGDRIPIQQTGRNPEVEEVLASASLLLNGGGLDKVNTIVRELNAVTTGNEAELKGLLDNTTVFLGQLDQNKEALLAALEKVNNLAITANAQEGAIDAALDSLPQALTALDQQRDDLVRLTTALAELGDTATGVVQASRADVVANLKDLQPVLANLALAGDDLVANLSTFVSFPFPDMAVGGSLAAAQQYCPTADELPAGGIADTPSGCGGDWMNLNINVDLTTAQLLDLLGLGSGLPGTGAMPETALPTDGADASQQLTELVEGLSSGVPAADAEESEATPEESSASQDDASAEDESLCSTLGLCRSSVSSTAEPDVAGLLLSRKASR
ncbi:MAG: MCE family protein [Aeromicrobium sp.]|uniref:MCE family protein n=1 Tax=Aeromicrobium sp. TaxID=1871063 RepID=UPI0039E3BA9B